jgi:glycosyltransferase involved in cell wall biosynthesis
LRKIVRKLDLENLVSFEGTLKGKELSLALNQHDVMVIPSRCKEAFGIVALEGLACGCKIVCPDEGGLKEAAGKGSFIYRHNDLASLIVSIELAFAYSSNIEYDLILQAHLKQHCQASIANQYLDFINLTLVG